MEALTFEFSGFARFLRGVRWNDGFGVLPAPTVEKGTKMNARDEITEALMAGAAEIERLRKALRRIKRWEGEFPTTGRFWDEPENTQPMSYNACYGSNGERDYMRQVARNALKTPNVQIHRRSAALYGGASEWNAELGY